MTILSKSALASLCLLAVLPVASAEDGPPVVTIDNFTFKPPEITVRVGTMVTFKNGDDIPHAVAAADGSFHSKALDTGDTFAVTLTKPGKLKYFCSLHPFMQGSVTVTP